MRKYFLPTVKIKDYNVMIDGENVLDQPIKNDQRTYDNVRKIVTGQGYAYTTVGLLHYVYFINYYNMIAVDLSKQQSLDADLKAIQQINYTGNLNQAGNNNVFHC